MFLHKRSNAVFFRSSIERSEFIAPVVLEIENYTDLNIDYIVYLTNCNDDFESKKKIDNLKLFFKKINKKLILKFFIPPKDIIDCFMQSKMFTDKEMGPRYSPILLSIFEAFKFLKKYRKIICIGTDVVVTGDIKGLFDKLSRRTPIAFRPARRLTTVLKNITEAEDYLKNNVIDADIRDSIGGGKLPMKLGLQMAM